MTRVGNLTVRNKLRFLVLISTTGALVTVCGTLVLVEPTLLRDPRVGGAVAAALLVALILGRVLQEIHDRVLARRTAGDPAAALPIIDLETVREYTEGDETILREVSELFIEESPRLIEELRDRLDSEDAVEIERVAHSLKGLAASMAAPATQELASKLEHAAAGPPDQLDSLFSALVVEVERAREALQGFLDTGTPIDPSHRETA